MDYSPPGSSVLGIFQARTLEWVAFPPPGDLPLPGIEPTSLGSPALQADSFTGEPRRRPHHSASVLKREIHLLISNHAPGSDVCKSQKSE